MCEDCGLRTHVRQAPCACVQSPPAREHENTRENTRAPALARTLLEDPVVALARLARPLVELISFDEAGVRETRAADEAAQLISGEQLEPGGPSEHCSGAARSLALVKRPAPHGSGADAPRLQ